MNGAKVRHLRGARAFVEGPASCGGCGGGGCRGCGGCGGGCARGCGGGCRVGFGFGGCGGCGCAGCGLGWWGVYGHRIARFRGSAGFTQLSYPTRSIAIMSASIRHRLVALALYRMVSATTETDEAHPQSHRNAHPISLLERLYRLELVSAGILWCGG